MKAKMKFTLTLPVALIVSGAILFAGVMTALGWDFSKLSTVEYELNAHRITEEFENVSIISDTAVGSISFLP